MKSLLSILTFLILPLQTFATETPPNWYQNFLFKNDAFTFEFIRTLGYSCSGAADIGECVSTALKIEDGNIYQWRDEWLQTADRLHKLALRMEEQGATLSAQEALHRASNYYRTAGFFLDSPEDRKQSIEIWEKSVRCFEKSIATSEEISKISIPYEETTLPGYFLKSRAKNAPLLIVHTGFDGTKEELYFGVGIAAHQRGYHVLIFEGPGQGEVLRKQGIPFRYDWEKVVTPVVDYALTIPEVNPKKICLLGISMGGYLAARAAAFEPRLAACILNGGIYDFSAPLIKTLPEDVLKLLDQNPEQFNIIIKEEMPKNISAYWFYNNGMWTFGVTSPAEFMNQLKRYNLKEIVQKIECPTLVLDSEADYFLKGQPQEVYDKLRAPKTLLKFSAETTAQAHCQMGALSISNEEVFAWLGKIVQTPTQN